MTVLARRASDPWAPSRWARRVDVPRLVQVGGRSVAGSTCRAVLLMLASYANPDGSGIRVAVGTVAEDMGRDERTVRAALRALEALGLIDGDMSRGRGHRLHAYRLVMGPCSVPVQTADSPGVTRPENRAQRPPENRAWRHRKTGHGAPQPPVPPTGVQDPDPAADAAAARARRAREAPPPPRSTIGAVIDPPGDLDELREQLARAGIEPVWNLTGDQLAVVRAALDRAGVDRLVTAARRAHRPADPLAWWSGLVRIFAAVPAPPGPRRHHPTAPPVPDIRPAPDVAHRGASLARAALSGRHP